MVAWETLQHQPHRREVTKRPQRQGSPLARAAHGGRGHASRFMKKILYLKTLFTQTCGLCTKYTRIPLLVPTFLPGCLNLGLPTLCPQLPQLRSHRASEGGAREVGSKNSSDLSALQL